MIASEISKRSKKTAKNSKEDQSEGVLIAAPGKIEENQVAEAPRVVSVPGIKKVGLQFEEVKSGVVVKKTGPWKAKSKPSEAANLDQETLNLAINEENPTKMKRNLVRDTFRLLKVWRKTHLAPVDSMGAHMAADQKEADINERAYQFLVGVLLSVQSQDAVTARVMQSLVKDGVSIKKYANLSEDQIREKISGINFNQKKAQFIRDAAIRVRDHHKGKFPDTLKELLEFSGVGNKVANLVLQQAFQKSVGIAVDVHVHRITNRLGWVNAKTPDETMTALHEFFEPDEYEDVNVQFVGLGQLLCKANEPKCLECPLSQSCKTGMKSVEKVVASKKKFTKLSLSKTSIGETDASTLPTEDNPEEKPADSSVSRRKTRATMSSPSPSNTNKKISSATQPKAQQLPKPAKPETLASKLSPKTAIPVPTTSTPPPAQTAPPAPTTKTSDMQEFGYKPASATGPRSRRRGL